MMMMDKKDFLLLYKIYIRPHIEYCVQSWSPHLSKDIKHLERVQKAATELVSSMKKLSYDERLKRLGLTTLQKRRARGNLIEVYRIMTGKIAREQFFRQAEKNHGLRGHSMKLKKERSRLDIRTFFFSQRVVNG